LEIEFELGILLELEGFHIADVEVKLIEELACLEYENQLNHRIQC